MTALGQKITLVWRFSGAKRAPRSWGDVVVLLPNTLPQRERRWREQSQADAKDWLPKL